MKTLFTAAVVLCITTALSFRTKSNELVISQSKFEKNIMTDTVPGKNDTIPHKRDTMRRDTARMPR